MSAIVTLIEDTRNQIGKHDVKRKQIEDLGYRVIRSKLPAGDYALMKNLSVVIDTKQDLQEIINNVCGKEHRRFRDECILCQEAGVKLIILCEHMYARTEQELELLMIEISKAIHKKKLNNDKGGLRVLCRQLKEVAHNVYNPIKDIEDLKKWENPRLKASPKATRGETLYKVLKTMEVKYEVEFLFCSRDETGKKILELLGAEPSNEI